MSNRLALRILSGSLEGETFAIGEGGLTIGRRPANDLVLEDASVSGAHAKLSLEDGELWVADTGSTNGTRVGGRKVERMSLLAGDEITFGSVRTEVVEADDAAGAEPAVAGAAPAAAGGFDDVDEISLEDPDEPIAPTQVPGAAAMPAASVAREVPAQEVRPAPARRPAPATTPAAQKAPPADLGGLGDDDGLIEADLDAFDRRQKGSKAISIAVGLVVLVGAGVGGWLAFGPGAGGDGDGGEGGAPAAVEPIAGNLLGADFSFEASGDAATWEPFGESPAVLSRSRAGAIRGRGGLFARLGSAADTELPDGSVDWAARASERVDVRVGQVVEARVATTIEGDAWARVGVLLESSDGPLGRGRVRWSAASTSSDELAATLAIPFGATGARVVLAAGGDGTVGFDDAAIVLVDAPDGPGEVGEFDVQTTGAGGDVLLARSDRPVIVVRAASGPLASDPAHALTVESVADAPSVELVLGAAIGDPAGRRLHLELPADDEPRHAAVVADGAYRAFGADFQAESVTQLLLGRGLELVRFAFDEPVSVRGRRDAFGLLVDVELEGLSRVTAQLAFTSERGAAATLASATRRARTAGQAGDALAGWTELLANYAFQDDLVAEAESAISQLTTAGSAELETLTGAVERAAFFALPGVYDECAARARSIAERYTPTDGGTNAVRDAALDLLARIQDERAALVAESADSVTPSRREAIRRFLERTGRETLIDRVAAGESPR